MRKQRQLRRLDFDLIQAEMSVISGELLRSIVGGYKNDCFWGCIAYIEYGGCYSKSDVTGYAESYFGPDVDLNTRKDGAAMDTSQTREFITKNTVPVVVTVAVILLNLVKHSIQLFSLTPKRLQV